MVAAAALRQDVAHDMRVVCALGQGLFASHPLPFILAGKSLAGESLPLRRGRNIVAVAKLFSDTSAFNSVLREIDILSDLRHTNVVRFVGASYDTLRGTSDFIFRHLHGQKRVYKILCNID